jgi:phage-related tail protein
LSFSDIGVLGQGGLNRVLGDVDVSAGVTGVPPAGVAVGDLFGGAVEVGAEFVQDVVEGMLGVDLGSGAKGGKVMDELVGGADTTH